VGKRFSGQLLASFFGKQFLQKKARLPSKYNSIITLAPVADFKG
jgi:hypothetical protein